MIDTEKGYRDGGDPTFHVEVEYPDGRREVVPHSDEMESWQAIDAANRTWKRFRKWLCAVYIVNEQSGTASRVRP